MKIKILSWTTTPILFTALAVTVPLAAQEEAATQEPETPAGAPTLSVLYAFTGGIDGANPTAALIRDGAGNLYGTSSGGGNTSGSCPFYGRGCGVVFKLDPAGNETVLYTFSGGADGSIPSGALIRDGAGNLYGTTNEGGNASCNSLGCGAVFELDSAGNEKVLHSFMGGSDGAGPQAGLVRDSAGNLYGTTSGGGVTDRFVCPSGCGVVFELSPTGIEKVLHSFIGSPDGYQPTARLYRDTAGNLYGTTLRGGTCPWVRCGVVFKLDPAENEKVLYRFKGGADGLFPSADVVRDAGGNLYGTTMNGGAYGAGVVFKLSPTGIETVLHSFRGGADGAMPRAGLIRDSSGNLYGTTLWGGNTSGCSGNGCGVVFKLGPTGIEAVLHRFTGGADGANPYAGLIRDSSGNLYGTTAWGGAYGNGVVFKLTP